MDGQLPGGDRIGDRIHQERHVVVDDADAHAALARLAAGRFDGQCELAGFPLRGDLGEEFGGGPLGLAPKALGFAGKRVVGQRLTKRIDQRLGQAHVGRHGKVMLRGKCDARGV